MDAGDPVTNRTSSASGEACLAVVPYEGKVQVLEVLDVSPNSKTYAFRETTTDMLFPVLAQRWVSVEGITSVSPDLASMAVVPYGFPEVLDAAALSGVKNMAKTLRRWKRGGPLEDGSLQLVSPSLWLESVPQPLKARTTPAWHLLNLLKRDGWTRNEDVAVHSLPIEDRHVRVSGCVQRKSYMLCLMECDNLAALGCTEIHTMRPEAVYRCVLERNPQLDQTLSPETYKLMLANGEGEVQPGLGMLAIRSDPQPLALCDEPHLVDDPADGVGTVISNFVVGARRAQRVRREPRPVAVPPPPPIADPDGDGPVDEELQAIIDFSLAPPVPMMYGTTVEGVEIKTEIDADRRRKYRRWSVQCPLSDGLHECASSQNNPCRKYRGAGEQQMAMFGVAELYAYLGLWIRTAGDYTDRKSHVVDFRPSRAALRAYIDEHGWI